MLDRVRAHCLGLPEVEERLSHGAPAWFVRGKKLFVTYMDDHHGDGRLALWCAAPPGMQAALVAGEPEHYFVPAYVGHRGWLGVRLDRSLAWNEVAGAIEDAYCEVAPKALVGQVARAAAVRTAHTADLEPAVLEAARALLDEAFGSDFSDHDWEHSLGGVHALVWEGDELIAHGALIQRRLLHGGRALRAGYVEAVGVRADRRRRGHGGSVMEALERVLRGAYDVGALSATDAGAAVYAARGWKRWQGGTSALTPAGVVRTDEDDGSVYVLPLTAPLELTGELTCDWRDGDVW